MSDDIRNHIALDFANANLQSQQWLREEVRELQLMLAAVIESHGGRISAYSHHIAALDGPEGQWSIESVRDDDNRRVDFSVKWNDRSVPESANAETLKARDLNQKVNYGLGLLGWEYEE